ncbi:helix-turn-helix domain-containing protein [Phycicoccus avicenniae]|uniref:helix-turn-helix domain-containing protein n=1 Tax=Phycicoccus avicenniae TaxID=2828860 RepID=UPI003D2B005D
MDEQAAALAATIGSRVRGRRQAKGWTLDQLAGAADVSRRAVVNVEQGVANPSVGTLLRLSDALGVGLPVLVGPAEPLPVAMTRAGEGAVLWNGEHGGRAVLVAGTEPPDVAELWDWTLAVGECHESEAHAAGTQELIQVHAGTLTLGVGDQSLTLSPGDAVAFSGDVAHRYANESGSRVQFSLAVFEPGVGASPTSEASHG